MYAEFKPTIDTALPIASFWFYSNDLISDSFKLLPDNCTDLIFDLSENKIFISGVMSKFQTRSNRSNASLIGVRFKSEYFSQLITEPMHYFKNKRTELKELLPVNLNINDQILHCDSVDEQLVLLQNFIIGIKNKANKSIDTITSSVTTDLRKSKGRLDSKTLAHSYHISLRQLERRFKNTIGITLKEFSTIVRFNASKKLIAQFPWKSLSEIAYDSGYYDHAHMTNDYKRVSGEVPSYFR